jgi:hypothetical protein
MTISNKIRRSPLESFDFLPNSSRIQSRIEELSVSAGRGNKECGLSVQLVPL